ncbi:MAG TPA: glucose-1-phosphate thymidylyltransferase RfbA [Patescibacteria group bacterium]|nr:glucose-1-phosphate thymidylyltransferase RfbA [Patescibacteria group bacterium]
MKGIILAGGSGTRLYPITKGICKQLMPIYDKPMIYYPLSTLMLAGIRDILIITTPIDQERFKNLLGDGSDIGCKFTYVAQDEPRGLADAFIVGADFIGEDKVCLILGDNIFYGVGFGEQLEKNADPDGGIIFAYHTATPERLGVVEFDGNMRAISIEEKPEKPKSSYGIPGLYFFDNDVVEIAKQVKPSARGELEITEIHNAYLKRGKLQVRVMDRGTAWMDPGNFDDVLQAAHFIQVIEQRQNLKIGCIEEVAYRQGFIDASQLEKLANGPLKKSGYGQYLLSLIS